MACRCREISCTTPAWPSRLSSAVSSITSDECRQRGYREKYLSPPPELLAEETIPPSDTEHGEEEISRDSVLWNRNNTFGRSVRNLKTITKQIHFPAHTVLSVKLFNARRAETIFLSNVNPRVKRGVNASTIQIDFHLTADTVHYNSDMVPLPALKAMLLPHSGSRTHRTDTIKGV
jgi:hypothetical protein